MNAIASGFPILTFLTVLPLIGAAIALFAGKHARGVALITSLVCLVVALLVWISLPANGIIGLVELHQLGAFAWHRVSPWRRWPRRAHALALRHRHAHVG